MPEASYRRLLPDLEAVALQPGATLVHQGERMRSAYFPVSGILSLSYALDGNGVMANAWPVGREGMVGVSLLLGDRRHYNRADVQIGGLAYRMPGAALHTEFERAGAFQKLLLRYVAALVTQASQLCVCSHYHAAEQRLCRFLAMLFDRVPGADVVITQERIGEMLGIRRVSVTESALRLQSAGVITYRRGHIRLISRKKLEARACACSAIIRRAFAAVRP